MTDPDAGGLPQALASAPRCASCSHLGSGFLCRLRDLDVQPTEATTCASHSDSTRKPDLAPVGPVLRLDDTSVGIVAESPTDAATRDHLFELLGRLYDDLCFDGSLRHRLVLWQSHRFDERRARYMLETVELRSLPGEQPQRRPLEGLGMSGLLEPEDGSARNPGDLASRPFTFAGRTLAFTACLVFAGSFWLQFELLVQIDSSAASHLARIVMLPTIVTALYVELGRRLARKRGIPLREPQEPTGS